MELPTVEELMDEGEEIAPQEPAAPSAAQVQTQGTELPTPDQLAAEGELVSSPEEEGQAKHQEATEHLEGIRTGKIHADLNDAYRAELAALGGKSFTVRMYDKMKNLGPGISKLWHQFMDKPTEGTQGAGSDWGDDKEVMLDEKKWYELSDKNTFGTLAKSVVPALADLPATAVDIGATLAHAPITPQGIGEEIMHHIPALNKIAQDKTAKDYAIADTFRGLVEKRSNEYADAVGLDRNTFTAQAMAQVPYFLIPGGNIELGAAVDSAVANVARMASKGKIVALGAAAKAAPTVAKGAKIGAAAAAGELGLTQLGAPHGLSGAMGGLMEIVRESVGMGSKAANKNKVTDKIFKAVSGMSRQEAQEQASIILKAAKDDPASLINGESAMKQINEALGKKVQTLEEEVANHRINMKSDEVLEADKLKSDGSWMRPTNELKGESKMYREKLETVNDLKDKMSGFDRQTKFERFLNDTEQYLDNIAAQTTLGAAMGEGFTGAITPTGSTDEVGVGALLGGGLGVLAAPFAAKSGMYSNRLARGEAALIERGRPLIPEADLEGISVEHQRHLWKMAGAADGIGGVKVKVVGPSESALAAGEAAKPGAGAYDPKTKTIYINRDSIMKGAPEHEFTHATQQAFGDMLATAAPEKMAVFEGEYRKAIGDPNFKFDSISERDAEVGRVLLQNTPIEAFFGGEGGGDMLRKAFTTILGKVNPEWYYRHQVDPLFSTPFTKADMTQMRARMFEAGEMAAKNAPEHTAHVPADWLEVAQRGLKSMGVGGDHTAIIRQAVERLGGTPADEQALFNEAVRVATGKPPPIPEHIRAGATPTSKLPQSIEAQLMPHTDPSLDAVIKDYAEETGLKYKAHEHYRPLNEEYSKELADAYSMLEHKPNDPKVRASYDKLRDGIMAQYNSLLKHGYKIEPWPKEGQPYADSAAMLKDLRENKHLYYFETERGYGDKGGSTAMQHPMLRGSGIFFNGKEALINDIFRGVHDALGHGTMGFQFGPRGEYNAFLTHASTLPHESWGALATETIGQNSWTNFGPHMRDASGKLLKKGEEGYVELKDRPFTEQRANLLKFMPEKADDGIGVTGPNLITANEVKGTDSKPMEYGAFLNLRRQGHQQLADLRKQHGSTEGLEGEPWNSAKQAATEAVQSEWGGVTIDPATGKNIELKKGYALSAKIPTQKTIEIPINASPEELSAAMERAKQEFEQLGAKDHFLGVFRDENKGTIDIDPIVVVQDRAKVDSIGSYTRAVGGAYDYATGNGVYPPHVDVEMGRAPAGPKLASSEWDSTFVSGEGLEGRENMAKELGIPEDKHFFEQKPDARQKIKERMISEGRAQFMPSTHPDAIKQPAFQMADGTVISEPVGYHSMIKLPREYRGSKGQVAGFITNKGEFLDRKQALARAKEHQQISEAAADPRNWTETAIDQQLHAPDVREGSTTVDWAYMPSPAGELKWTSRHYDMTPDQLEQFLIFGRSVAGHASKERAPKIEKMLTDLLEKQGGTSPIAALQKLNKTEGGIEAFVKEHGFGPYGQNIEFLKHLAESRIPDLKTITEAELTNIPHIGPKTARFFKAHTDITRGNNVMLDTHVLRFLRETGHPEAPHSTPQNPAEYEKWSKAFRDTAEEFNLTPSDLDLQIWLDRSGNMPKEHYKALEEIGAARDKQYMPDTFDKDFVQKPPMPDVVLDRAMKLAYPANTAKTDKIGQHRTIEKGTPVDVRIDIPTYNKTQLYAQTIHEPGIGGVKGYDSIVKLDGPVSFGVNEKLAKRVQEGNPKSPFAVVKGKFNPDRKLPSDINDLQEWTPTGFNPKKHSYFYDKETGTPVTGGSQAISIDNTVYVKDAEFGNKSDYQYMPQTFDANEPIWSRRLKELSNKDWEPTTKLTAAEESELTALHKQAEQEYGSYANWFEQMGGEKQYTEDVFGPEPMKDVTPRAQREVPERFYWREDMGHNPAIVDRLTDKVIDRWEGPDAGEYSSTAGYESPQAMVDAMNADIPRLPPNWAGPHPDAYIPEIVRQRKDGTWGLDGPNDTIQGTFKTAEEANAALQEAHRTGYNPEEPARLSYMPRTPDEMPTYIDKYKEQHPDSIPIEFMKDKKGEYRFPKNSQTKQHEAVPQTYGYDLNETPLAQQARKGIKNEEEAHHAVVKAYVDKMIPEAQKALEVPEVAAAKGWYRVFKDKVQTKLDEMGLGEHVDKFMELVSATSPQNDPWTNFRYAVDAWNQWRKGEYADLITRYHQEYAKFQNGELKTSKGKPMTTVGQFEDHLTNEGIAPLQSNGKKFGKNTPKTMHALAGTFLDTAGKLKIHQFVHNLLQKDLNATIDMWAGRTMHRLGNEGYKKRWRMLPFQESGVMDVDFRLGQDVFREVAKQLNMSTDDLQALMWFHEKKTWYDRGYSNKVDYGDFRPLVDYAKPTKEGTFDYEPDIKAYRAATRGLQP